MTRITEAVQTITDLRKPLTAMIEKGRRSAEELLITTLPPATVPIDDQLRLP